MGKCVRILLVVLLVLSAVQVGCMRFGSQKEGKAAAVRIKDNVFYHNISITHDGRHYFTINGGNSSYCVLNEYDSKGKHIRSYDVGLDGRAIFYNPIDRRLYVKGYGRELYRIDLEKEEAVTVPGFEFSDENSSPGMSPDGKFFYEFTSGEVLILDSMTGLKAGTVLIDGYFDGHGYGSSVAASRDRLFIWGDERVVIVFDLDGNQMNRVELPEQGFSYSLSYCNNMLWIAVDADAVDQRKDGFWLGYRM